MPPPSAMWSGAGTSTSRPRQIASWLEICKDESAPSGRVVSWKCRMEAYVAPSLGQASCIKMQCSFGRASLDFTEFE
ncbi:unnamed protein product [Fusarium venenatum]|uniref:Uncharacterized protein n=1 Tax=Fusarium venenatum TaxID=56646 RepID=A0A2L2T8Q9_9HYPO|nr:uncharacterized protein FVRRES_03794 [Fusarium venenatum]CEI67282.1 unnamed protein product [Fusarium venenatum]